MRIPRPPSRQRTTERKASCGVLRINKGRFYKPIERCRIFCTVPTTTPGPRKSRKLKHSNTHFRVWVLPALDRPVAPALFAYGNLVLMSIAAEPMSVDSDLLAQVAKKYRGEVRSFQSGMFDDAAEFRAKTFQDWNPPSVVVRSLTDRFLNLSIILSHIPFEKAFPKDPDATGAHKIHLSVGSHHKELRSPSKTPPAEASAWAAAIFGPWANDAYSLCAIVRNSIGRPPALHFALYVTGDGVPRQPPPGDLEHRPLSIA